MASFQKAVELPCSIERAFQYHDQVLSLQRLIPPWQAIGIELDERSILDGKRKILRVPIGPMGIRWEAIHQGYRPPHEFIDTQGFGPFASWTHRHRFESLGDYRARMTDAIDFEAPGPAFIARWIEARVQRELKRLFQFRHRLTYDDIQFGNWLGWPSRSRIAITGASGLVGQRLSSLLSCLGHEVIAVQRSQLDPQGKKKAPSQTEATHERHISWDPAKGILKPSEWEELDAVIHLAGENIGAGRWTLAMKERLRSSRVDATRRLVENLGRLDRPPKAFVAASAIGIYGDQGDRIVSENTLPGTGFLPNLAVDWERSSEAMREIGTRLCYARLAMVLHPRLGALGKMLPLFRWGLGGRLGSGQQWWSWIDVEDAASALAWMALSAQADGAYNVASPEPVTNRTFTTALAKSISRPAWFPAPKAALRLVLGEMADGLLLTSCRVLPDRLMEKGFPFRYPNLDACLTN